MDNSKRDKKFTILLTAIIVCLLITIISTTFAYFTISNKTGSEETITSGTMRLTLTDGSKVETENMLPGDYIEKQFTVTNTGSLATSYDIYLSEVINTFTDKTDLVYSITSADGGYNTANPVQAPSASAKIIDNQSIAYNGVHHYTLRITFLNKNENQDDNQGKSFSGKIQINEYTDVASSGGSSAPATIASCPNCKFTNVISEWDEVTDEVNNLFYYGSGATALTNAEYNSLYTDYRQLIQDSGRSYFLGFEVDDSTHVISKAYSCGMYDSVTPICIQGTTDGSAYNNNVNNVLVPVYGPYDEETQLGCHIFDYGSYSDTSCYGDLSVYVYEDGMVGANMEDGLGLTCDVESEGYAHCYYY